MLIFLAALALQPAPPSAASRITVSQQARDPADDQAVRTASEAFLTAKDEGRSDAAYAMLAPSRQAQRPRAGWDAAARDFNSHAGASRGRRIAAVSWLTDPSRSIPLWRGRI